MDPHYEYSLHTYVSSPGPTYSGMIEASVQVWRAGVHIDTLKLVDAVGNAFQHPEKSTVEQFAAQAARMIARLLEDHFLEGVAAGADFHSVRKYEEQVSRAPQ